MKCLILGGYGVFGGRLAELISDIEDMSVLVCGRSQSKADAFCGLRQGKTYFIPLALDRADIADALATQKPDVVIDASGPFQDYGQGEGEDPYGVVRACIAAGVNYLDFADASDFVFGISEFDAAAKGAGVSVLSGVSSFPVLTAAVLREMEKTMKIKSVTGGIAPSPYAGIGLNVMRAVVGYAGAPVTLQRGGKVDIAYGLTESLRYTVAVPGRLPLRNLHYSLVEVPDLQVIPRDMPSIENIWMGAGPVPEMLHRILNVFAKTRATLKLPSFAPFAPLFYRILNLMKFGEHRGGMFVEALGERGGKTVTQSWHLLAEGDDGPYIPSMAVEAILRKWLAGVRPKTGARPATRALELDDYYALFEGRTIYAAMREDAHEGSLYRQILGSAFDTLPAPLKSLHESEVSETWTGRAQCQGASNPLAGLIGKVIGFPATAAETPVSVTFTRDTGTKHTAREIWSRNFGGKTFSSTQYAGRGKNERLLMEKFGLVTVALAVVVEQGRLQLIPRRWFFCDVPLPKWSLPKADNYEFEDDGEFNFDVTIAAPIIGRIASYKGWLMLE